jgi:hypothetical protein
VSSIIVFTGPTLGVEDARVELDAVFLPPVSQGDVYRACSHRPRAIAIIDGYFERVPAVWHKEILWAMSRGIHVFGSSSMGALRAAELHTFGMVGVGRVFEAYRDGLLDDDDEVAVAHGPAEAGWRASSDAMVNIRATFERAMAAGILRAATHDALVKIAKDLYYPDRVYPTILAAALEQGLPAGQIAALSAFLPTGRINRKRDDALLLLRALRGFAETEVPPKVVDFNFEATEFWSRAQRAAGELSAAARGESGSDTVVFDDIVDELRLDPVAYRHAVRGAMLRHHNLMEAERRGFAVDGDALEGASNAFRRERRLYRPEDVHAWMRDAGLDWGGLTRLIRDEALITRVDMALAELGTERLRDELTVAGSYATLRNRAREKQACLEQRGLSNPSLAASGMTDRELVRWYFQTCAGTATPSDVTPALGAAGFTDAEGFRRVALREYFYRLVKSGDDTATGSTSNLRPDGVAYPVDGLPRG